MYTIRYLILTISLTSVLAPANSTENNQEHSIDPVIIPPSEQNAGEVCPANSLTNEGRENLSSSVRMLLQSRPLGVSLEECGDGFWYRVGFLNMSDPGVQCPLAWREYNQSGVRACGRPTTDGGSCVATFYPADNVEYYNRVCGLIIGYQFASPDAFAGRPRPSSLIDDAYLDGISLTYGSPRTHIWSFAGSDLDNPAANPCPCGRSTDDLQSPSFVGDSYFCETGHNNAFAVTFDFITDDPLWDGQNCPVGNCCTFNNPPWFSVVLNAPTTDDIEVRICADQETDDEDTPISLLELYVQ